MHNSYIRIIGTRYDSNRIIHRRTSLPRYYKCSRSLNIYMVVFQISFLTFRGLVSDSISSEVFDTFSKLRVVTTTRNVGNVSKCLT